MLQKAMVFTLTAAMLIGTPLSASAAGLVDLYKIEDQWGDNVDENGNKTDVIHGNSNTGTVTSTGSRTAVLDNEGTILGISLSETRVELELDGAYDGKKEEATLAQGKLTDGNCLLNVSILTDKELPKEEYDALFKSLTWKSSDPNVVSFKNFKNGTSHDKLLSAKAGGDATVTVSLDNYAEDIHFKATADVHVKQYASDVKFVFPEDKMKDGKPIGYVKHTVNLNEVLVKTPATANDDIIFEIVEQKDSKGTVKNSGIAKIKDSSVTYQKTGSVSVVAVPEKATKARADITIDEGKPASKVDVKVKGTETFKKTTLQADKDGVNLELEAVLYTKASGKSPITNRADCTDDIVWSSKKPAIVDIVGSSKGDSVKLIAKGVGSSTITATASSGKKGTFTVTVKADMTGIEIVSTGGDLYGGQSYGLEANTKFGNAPDNFDPKATLKWEIDKNKSADKGKYAKIKGNVLTLVPQVKAGEKITVTVKSTKKYGGKNITPAGDPKEVVFTMKQADVKEIIVYENEIEKPLAKTTEKFKDANLKGNITVAAGKNKTLNVVALDKDGHSTIWEDGQDTGIALASTLNWASANTKIATVKNGTKSGTVFAGTEKAGKSKITVSGTRLNGSKYVALKTTFNTTVTRPAEWIKISTKANVIKATGKAQTVKYTVTLPKGTTCKANDVEWMVYKAEVKTEGEATKIDREWIAGGKLKGSIKLPKDSYKAGDWLEITATAKDKDDKSSVTTSAMIRIVTPSYGVEIHNAETGKAFDKNKTTLALDGVVKISTMVNVGTGKTAEKGADWMSPNAVKDGKVAAGVTYTVNKKGIIYITNGEIRRIKPGTVKLTATTADGKKATLTIN